MKSLWRKFFGESRRPEGEYPRSMQDLRGGDRCWCGSDKPYRKCHRSEDRRRKKELGLGGRKKSICDAFT